MRQIAFFAIGADINRYFLWAVNEICCFCRCRVFVLPNWHFVGFRRRRLRWFLTRYSLLLQFHKFLASDPRIVLGVCVVRRLQVRCQIGCATPDMNDFLAKQTGRLTTVYSGEPNPHWTLYGIVVLTIGADFVQYIFYATSEISIRTNRDIVPFQRHSA